MNIRPEPLSAEHLAALRGALPSAPATMPDLRAAIILRLMLFEGMRQGAISRLTMGAYQPRTAEGPARLEFPGKFGLETVILSDETADLMDEYLGRSHRKEGELLHSAGSNVMTRTLDEHAEKAGVPCPSPHAVRNAVFAEKLKGVGRERGEAR
ncbi:site-specific integrase [Streptomyces sp. CS014]|uniref:site-specific integrase n=1 Tax=Streptomyces sp. CS014 TaxID=2162707 RepID=UPI000D50CCC4|nr:site-specific integrase [Streptomyces sp. CS014]PVD04489.1 hypothetical protein DBP12_03425 [Streptomyces sp. CS014]